MGLGRATESILDLKALEPGRAPMLIAISGPELILKLDVYDAGPPGLRAYRVRLAGGHRAPRSWTFIALVAFSDRLLV